MVNAVSTEFRLQMSGYGLTTAEIHYHLPDHPSLLQLYVWQDYDLAPDFPTLRGFLGLLGTRAGGRLAFRSRRPPSAHQAIGMAGRRRDHPDPLKISSIKAVVLCGRRPS